MTAGRTATNGHPAVDTVAQLAATGWRRIGTSTPGDGWVSLGEQLRDPAALDRWYGTELSGPAGGHRDLAGALIAYRFAGSLADLVMGPLLEQQRVLLVEPEDIWLQLAGGTRIDALAVDTRRLAVLPRDPAATHGDAVVTDREGLRRTAAGVLHDVFAPVAAAVRARAPFGLRGMWGTLADHVAEGALDRARGRGRDAETAWSEADAVIGELAGSEALLRARPRRHPVPGPAGGSVLADKGTCCLIYKVIGAPAPGGASTAREQIAAGACAACPLRSPEDRHDRFTRYVAGHHSPT